MTLNSRDISVITTIVEKVVKGMEERVLIEVNRAVEYHRRATWMREDWCCNDMRTFAIDTWGTSRYIGGDSGFGPVGYQLHGKTVNYCPFCGVFAGAHKKK